MNNFPNYKEYSNIINEANAKTFYTYKKNGDNFELRDGGNYIVIQQKSISSKDEKIIIIGKNDMLDELIKNLQSIKNN